MPYSPYTWSSGDVLTPARLNNIETQYTEAIAANGQIPTGALAVNAVTQTQTDDLTGTTFSTSSTTYVDVTGLSVSITTVGGDLLIFLEGGPTQVTGSSGYMHVAVQVNGTDYLVYHQHNTSGSSHGALVGHVRITGLAAGTYTIKARAKSNNGANSQYVLFDTNGIVRLTVVELKK